MPPAPCPSSLTPHLSPLAPHPSPGVALHRHTPCDLSRPVGVRLMAAQASIGIRAANALDAHCRDVQYRWIQRLVTYEPYSLRPSLPLPEALGQVSSILAGLSAALRSTTRVTPEQREDALRQAVKRHAEL